MEKAQISKRKAVLLATNPPSKKKPQKTERMEKFVFDPEPELELISEVNSLSKNLFSISLLD